MKLKQTIISLIVLIVVIAIMVMADKYSKKEPSPDKTKFLAKFSISECGKIMIASGKDTAVLKLDGDQWKVASEKNYPADTAKINLIFDKINKLHKKYLQAAKPQTHADLEVDSAKGVMVSVGDRKGGLIGDFYIGKSTPEYTGNYIRCKGENEVYCAEETIKWDFTTKKNEWRDKTLCNLDKNSVVSVELNYLDEVKKEEKKSSKPAKPEFKPYYLKMEQDTARNWTMVSENNQPASKEKVEQFLSWFNPFKTDEWVEDTVAQDFGFDKPYYKAMFKTSGGKEVELLAGGETDNKLYVKISDRPGIVFRVYKYKIDNVKTKFNDLKLDKPKDEVKKDSATVMDMDKK